MILCWTILLYIIIYANVSFFVLCEEWKGILQPFVTGMHFLLTWWYHLPYTLDCVHHRFIFSWVADMSIAVGQNFGFSVGSVNKVVVWSCFWWVNARVEYFFNVTHFAETEKVSVVCFLSKNISLLGSSNVVFSWDLETWSSLDFNFQKLSCGLFNMMEPRCDLGKLFFILG